MKLFLRRIIFNINKFLYRGKRNYCNICGKNYRKFLSAGGDKRLNARCPGCGSFERHRLLMYFLNEKTNIFTGNKKVLDISPLQTFHNKFNKLENISYTSIDLIFPYVTRKADLTNLPFKDETFDCIFCYHVLEHIDNDIKAISEMFRVLKRGGWAIIQSPFDKNMEITFEDKSVSSAADRKKVYGQFDHVRIYGRDFINRIESTGFVVTEDDFVSNFNEEEINKFGLDREEIINFCVKQ